MNKQMKRLLLCLFLSLSLLANAQLTVTQDTIQDSILTQLTLFPQEKLHLHTDRTVYVPGEKIWFKVYVADAATHRSTYSQYAYVELINPSDSLVRRVMVRSDTTGLFHGNLFLSDYIPEGDYTIRAYTRFMENLGGDYFFVKPIRINNLEDEKKKKQEKRQSNNNYEVSFFPEGGNLTEGVSCRVAFKVLNSNGTSQPVTGEIVDDKGEVVATANTVFAGMGSFFITPEAGASYYFNCKNQQGREKRFKLPPAHKTASIATTSRNNRHWVEVKKTPDIPESPLFLLIQCRGTVYYFASWNDGNPPIILPYDQFPSGVLQITLLDGQMNPLSERLVYNKNEDQAKLTFSWNKPVYQTKERVSSEIRLTDPEGNPLAGHVSIAVTDDKDITVDNLHTISSSLLLSSELRGYIESPGYYLQDSKEAELALDHLMMTHGWRRYDISEAIKGNYRIAETGYEDAREISGIVKGGLLGNRPVVNGEVLFTSTKDIFGETVTDSTGRFHFYLHYPDSTRFFVQAKNAKGGSSVELILNQEKFPALKYVPQSQTDINDQLADDASDFMEKTGQRAKYDNDIRVTLLPEVTVIGRRIDKRDEIRSKNWAAQGSDRTIYREEFENRHVNKITDLLITVSGVHVSSGGITIRGNDGSPSIFVDGVRWPGSLNDLSAFEIESIDVFKGATAAMFGFAGANGVISVTRRQGTIVSPLPPLNVATFSPLGYQSPVEFYAPKYDTQASREAWTPDYRTTIYWKPDVLVSEEGKGVFDFYTSGFPTTYSVVIEGLSEDGRIIRQVERIEVE